MTRGTPLPKMLINGKGTQVAPNLFKIGSGSPDNHIGLFFFNRNDRSAQVLLIDLNYAVTRNDQRESG